MPEQKKYGRNLYPQTNIRFTDVDRERIQFIANEMHKAGLPGFLDRQFRPITTEVIRYLIEDKEAQLKQKRRSSMDTKDHLLLARDQLVALLSALREQGVDSAMIATAETALANLNQTLSDFSENGS
jgi:hypothetical protein